jgi:restriction endonuclease S subunit
MELSGRKHEASSVGVWQEKQLREFCVCFSGGTPSTSNAHYYNGDINWITSGDLNQKRIRQVSGRISMQGLENSAAKLTKKGTLLVALYGATAGVTAISEIEGAINQAILAVIPRDVDNEFLFQKLSFLKDWIITTYTQGGQPNLSGEIIRSISITLPTTLAEQTAIATALSDTDALITGLEKLIEKKRMIKQGVMQELLRPKKGWRPAILGDVIERIVGGGTPSRSNPQFWGKEIPWVTVKDFATFDSIQTQEYITREGLANSASNLIPKGTLITSTRMALGKAVIYMVDVSINQDLKAMFPRKDLNVNFLYYWFELNQKYIESLGSGSTVAGLSLGELKRIPFALPPINEQVEISAALSSMDGELAVLNTNLAKYRRIKFGMMQALLTGRIRLV